MSEQLDAGEALAEAMSETFEGMAFLELQKDFTGDRTCRGSSSCVWSKVEILQPHPGFVLLCAPKDLVSEIWGALYGGLDDTVTEQKLMDTLGELVNTVAGKALGSIVPVETTYTLGVPKSGVGDPAEQQGTAYGFLTDDERRLVVLIDF